VTSIASQTDTTAARLTPGELVAVTEAGRRLVACAEASVAICAETATANDQDGRFAFESIRALQESGFLAGPVPEAFGGGGVESVHDLMVAVSRLARGDASTAIAANMHLAGIAVIVVLLRRLRAEDDGSSIAVLEHLLEEVVAGRAVLCFPTSEPGTDLASPFTEAEPVDGGYLVSGHKIFGTISPIANLFFPTVRLPRPDGEGYLTATALITRDTPGLTIADDWDALGMRASGSNSIVMEDCFVPERHLFAVRDNYGRSGRWAPGALLANPPLAATYLGVAEVAHELAVESAGRRKGPHGKRMADRIPIQELVGTSEIDLAVCRAMVGRMGMLADDFMARHATSEPPQDEANALMKESQCMKYVVNHKAGEIVDRSMTICGGSAYMNTHPLTRLYRDVRAGPFMQPFSPYEAFEFIGKVALGLDPTIER
jgi:alkylation response protein AidB-like acyl-CoA dehydrogenase